MPLRNDLPAWLTEHLALYRADPVRAHDWDATAVGRPGIVPTLLLTTIGRRSGAPVTVPLLYQPAGEGFVVVGSKGGGRRHPAWFLNLQADPECAIQVGRFEFEATARVVSGSQRDTYWDLMTRVWPNYQAYQARTERQIPIVLLQARLPFGQAHG